MLISRPLPPQSPQVLLLHIHEWVEVLNDGTEKTPVSDFMVGLSDPELQDMYSRFEKLELKQFFAWPRWPEMGNWFKHLRHVGDVWEVGDDDRIRFYGFRHGAALVLTNASKKRGKKTPTSEVNRCVERRDAFKKCFR
jgi:phage-related protein